MRTTSAAALKGDARSTILHQLENALRRRNSRRAVALVKHTLKNDRSSYNVCAEMCDRFQAKDEVRVQCHKSYYQSALAPLDKVTGAIYAARIYRDQARCGYTASRLLRFGPYAVVKRWQQEDAAIKWFERGQRTGLSGGGQDLVKLLMRRATRCFVSSQSALQDHLAALRVTASALEQGQFYDGYLVALEKSPSKERLRCHLFQKKDQTFELS